MELINKELKKQFSSIPLAPGRKSLHNYDITFRVIIYKILSYLQYKCEKASDINIKALFGYFKHDYTRKIWLIWR